MKKFLLLISAAFLFACQPAEEAAQPEPAAEPTAEPAAEPAPEAAAPAEGGLAALLDAQPDEVKARYEWRHPQDTLEFFGIEPGMTVVEGLPGGGWYTKVLLPYLGSEGKLIGANYSLELFPLFGFFSQEQLDELQTWETDFPVQAEEWRGDDGAPIVAYHMGSMPADLEGTADVVFFVRVLHNLARFEAAGESATS